MRTNTFFHLPASCILSFCATLSHRKSLHTHIAPLRFLYPADILPRYRVPRRHVLLHALREACFFLFRKRAARRGNAFVKAVHVEFLP